ncbi:MAG: hypothetical protein M3R38_30165 [Actinomycetota bacterium]|nr:hypothetical protein [Actinomycetota bacterium]
MADFIALYRGPTIAGSQLVAVTAEPELVARFKEALAGEEPEEADEEPATRPLEVVRGE